MTKKDKTTQSPEFYITGLRPSEETGELLIDYQLTEEFRDWYKKKNNLKRWSRKRFEKELVNLVKTQMANDLGLTNKEETNE
tara:strand:+ start:145 stop:390 length:246 start_codon:yes stop_codon:yes gene_type:complete